MGLTYDIGALKLIGAYGQSRASFVGSGTEGRVSEVTLGADYVLSKRTDVYAFVARQRGSSMVTPGIFGQSPGTNASQTSLQMGVRHTF